MIFISSKINKIPFFIEIYHLRKIIQFMDFTLMETLEMLINMVF
jgi:hypothetical protein